MDPETLRRKLYRIMVNGTGYDEVPYEELSRQRYSFLAQDLERNFDEVWEIIFSE